jgi:biopolymer transport protein ExbD
MNAIDEYAQQEDESEINLTPMLDVVFIMLIFFIVTAVFIQQPGIDITRATANTTMPVSSSVYVAISQDNEIWLDGDQVDVEAVRYRIERLHAENPGSGIVIQADADAKNEYTIAVMDAAKAAGLTSTMISATKP